LTDIADTRLGKAVHAAAAGKANLSGVYALQFTQEAFAARVLLARAAERSLDVQYYIWRGDTTGYLLLEELWDAAERGVWVRLLLDDTGTAGLDPALTALDSHPNIQIRLFNPFVQRRYKALGYLTDFRRLNRRMHNKSFTADSVATIVGGRNVGDEYFGAGQGVVFADLDVLAVGSIARDVRAAFDNYWNADTVRGVDLVVGKTPPGGVSALRARFAAVRASAEAVEYVEAVLTTGLVAALDAQELQLDWARVQLLCDPPAKVKGQALDADLLFAHLRAALGKPERAIDLVSAYFVPGKKGTKVLARFAENGIALRILTNSLAATDVGVVHAGYAKRRKPLLRSGARIYELKPDIGDVGRAEGSSQPRHGVGSSSASLHAKTFSIDRARVFVGSFNLDPRSIRLNTEMGLVIDCVALAEAIANRVDRAAENASYEVVLAAKGRGLEWVERTDQGEVRYRTEPKTGLLRRLGISFLALLPIEKML